MSSELSYPEALAGLLNPDDIEAMMGLIEGHKSWGAFRARIPSHIVINLVDEVKRLRELRGGYKSVPEVPVVDMEGNRLD